MHTHKPWLFIDWLFLFPNYVKIILLIDNLISYVSASSASSSFVCTPANSDWPCFFLFFNLHEHKTQCKIEFTYASHSVSKNLTLRRMLKNSFLIAQIIRWNNSFQNMSGEYKMTFWRIIILIKKTPQNSPFESILEKNWGQFQVYFSFIFCLCLPYLELIWPFYGFLGLLGPF